MSKPVGPKLFFFVDFVGKVKMCLLFLYGVENPNESLWTQESPPT